MDLSVCSNPLPLRPKVENYAPGFCWTEDLFMEWDVGEEEEASVAHSTSSTVVDTFTRVIIKAS